MGAGRRVGLSQLVAEVRGRPLVIWAAALVIGMIARGSPAWAALLIPLGLVCGRSSRAWGGMGFALLGALISPLRSVIAVDEPRPFQGLVDVVSTAKPGMYGEQVTVVAQHDRLIWQLSPGLDVNWGDRVRVKGRFDPLEGPYGESLARQGYAGRLVSESAVVVDSGTNLARIGRQMRLSFSREMGKHLHEEDAAIVRALTFNDDARVTPELREVLRATGAIHIISTSGMHVMLLSLFVMALLGRLPIERWGQLVVLAILLTLYVAAAGWRPPAVRAMILALAMWVPYIFDREADGLSALSLALLVSLVWQPNEILNVGFQLSYVAVGALVLFCRVVPPGPDPTIWEVLRRNGLIALRGSIVATVATAPLLAYHFGEFSWIGPISNLAVGFAVLPIVAGSLGAWMIAPAWPGLTHLVLAALVGPLCGYLRMAMTWMASWPNVIIRVGEFPGWSLVLLYGAALLLWEPRQELPKPNS